MKVLLVIHGYPRQYNGGSEVYTQTLAHGLQNAGCGVSVFAREEDPFLPDCNLRMTTDPIHKEIDVYLVNYPRAVTRYQNDDMDRILDQVLDKTKPDLVHFGHLNHLSTNFPLVAKSRGLPILFTLHDFWLMCPRGQFLQSGVTSDEPWQLCSGQANNKCASRCFNRYEDNSGNRSEAYWEQWVANRMIAVRKACAAVDLFIAPSRNLMERHIKEFGMEEKKIVYMDYGFELGRLKNRRRNMLDRKKGFIFGYIGRHHPSKGIHLLIDAFCALKQPSRLRIWGNPTGQLTAALKRRVHSYSAATNSIEWMGEYHNEDIVKRVFNYCDCIVVPSIWDENSPLVIHESQQCSVPVITANHGGMKEYVKNGINGLTFVHRSATSLRNAMHKAMANPDKLDAISKRGYLFSENGQIPSLETHVEQILSHYSHLIDAKGSAAKKLVKSDNRSKSNLEHKATPWRITFDTNPDDCNLSCVMCEEHSVYSPKRMIRIANKTPHRRMSIETIENIIAECAPLGLREIIPSTMGEPLVYKHMQRIIELCHQYNVKLNLTTNGTFPKLGAKKWSELIVPVGKDIKISWNGADPESQKEVMHRNDFNKNLRNLRTLIQARNTPSINKGNYCSVTLQMTFMEMNLSQIPRVVELAIAEGVDRVKGHHLWVLFKEIKNQDLRRNKDSIRRWNKVVQECQIMADENPLPNGKRIRLDNIYKLESKHNTVPQNAICPFLGKEAWVNHEGEFNPCCAPDDLRRQLGSFDNVKNKGLLAIWQSPQYRNLVNNYLNNKICQNCTMRVPPAEQSSRNIS